MQRLIPSIGIAAFSALALAACVTIHIYFPAAAAEQAADRIIDEVWQVRKSEEGAKGEKPAAPQ